MIEPSYAQKHYASARHRFLKKALINFLSTEIPKAMGPMLRDTFADQLIALFESLCPDSKRIKPGQVLWNALDQNTRGDSPHRKFVPVVLSIITEKDVNDLQAGVPMARIRQKAIARIIKEAHQQKAALSMRDIGLILLKEPSNVSADRKKFEQIHNKPLPHTGVLHDMGTTITHKHVIVRKVVLEKKDPAIVARECYHSQKAVDRYLTDYHRVKTLHQDGKDLIYIHRVTAIAKHVVKQYLEIINLETKNEPENQ